MKKLLFFLLTISLPMSLAAQEAETLFGKGSRVGGFGGPIFELSEINNQSGTSFGGGGGVVVDDFFLGGFGVGSNFANIDLPDGRYNINFGYGGLWLGYTPIGRRVVHPYVSTRIAWGGIALSETRNEDWDFGDWDNVFVFVPAAGVEVNLFSWFRVGATLGYRMVNDVDMKEFGLTDNDFSGLTGNFVLRFGGFGY